MEGKEAIAEL